MFKIYQKNSRKGFTLLELLIVIVILGILAALISGNFITSLKKGRDAQRKSSLSQIQQALEMYYEDKKVYPSTSTISFGGKFCETSACADTEKVYMQLVPRDPSGKNLRYCTNGGASYQLYAALENVNDKSIITPATVGTCTADCPSCNYGVSSANATP